MSGDTIALAAASPAGEPLLEPVMSRGRRLGSSPTLGDIALRARQDLAALPDYLQRLKPGATYPVDLDEGLIGLLQTARRLLLSGSGDHQDG